MGASLKYHVDGHKRTVCTTRPQLNSLVSIRSRDYLRPCKLLKSDFHPSARPYRIMEPRNTPVPQGPETIGACLSLKPSDLALS